MKVFVLQSKGKIYAILKGTEYKCRALISHFWDPPFSILTCPTILRNPRVPILTLPPPRKPRLDPRTRPVHQHPKAVYRRTEEAVFRYWDEFDWWEGEVGSLLGRTLRGDREMLFWTLIWKRRMA